MPEMADEAEEPVVVAVPPPAAMPTAPETMALAPPAMPKAPEPKQPSPDFSASDKDEELEKEGTADAGALLAATVSQAVSKRREEKWEEADKDASDEDEEEQKRLWKVLLERARARGAMSEDWVPGERLRELGT